MKILAFTTSLREKSYNKMLLKESITRLKALGAEVEEIDLNHYLVPAYNADLQDKSGIHENAVKLSEKLKNVQAVVLSTPEYNHSYPGHFKNLFDWVSSQKPIPWGQKATLIMSASPSLVGGARCVEQIKVPFEACGAYVFPQSLSLSMANKAFNDENVLLSPEVTKSLDEIVKNFHNFARCLGIT